MKKIVLLVVGLCLTLFLVACHVEAPVTDTLNGDENKTEVITEDAVQTDDVAQTDDEEADIQGVGGDMDLCPVHYFEYHALVGPITKIVDYDDIMKWFDDVGGEDPEGECNDSANIKKFIDYFEIKKEDLMTVGFILAAPHYNVDFLFSATAEEIDEFYKDVDYLSVLNEYKLVYIQLCLGILEKHGDELKAYGIEEVSQMVVPEVAKLLGIEREELETIVKDYNDSRVNNEELDLAPYAWDGNYDLIYGDESDWTTELLIEAGIDTDKKCLTQYELMEKFCRIGREMDRDRAMGTEK